MADKISKYTFEQVEQKLDIIRNDQGSNKCLLGDGTYGELPKGGGGSSNITLDEVPTEGSNNAVKSKGVYSAIQTVSNEVTRTNQTVTSNTTKINQNTTNISNLTRSVEGVNTSIQQVNSEVEALNKSVENLQQSGAGVVSEKTYDKFFVFCIAGQSNAVGYDESPIDEKFTYNNLDTNRIKQLGFYGDQNLQLIDLGYCAQSMQDMRVNNRVGEEKPGTKGIHLPLANLMLDYIPDDYGVLVLPISYGGTGFTSGNNGTYSADLKKPTEADPKAGQGGQGTAILKWGTGTAYYQTLRDRIIHALELNDENLFAGIVWCQGENDMGSASGHKSGFEAMTQLLFDELNAHDSGALRARTPRGTFDRNIWYNMETVGYWYTQGQCQQIWDNYKTWNADTYVEIPRDTESNDVNGTGSTAGVRAKHYGNNAYQKVVAPRVLQKMIDMNTFPKKVNVVEPECEVPETTGGSSYPVATEGTRTFVQADILDKVSDITFTVNENGDCQASESLRGKFNTKKSSIHFGDVFKIEFEVKRAMYWLIVEQDSTTKYSVLGLSGNYTRQFAVIENGSLSITDQASNYSGDQYTLVAGDKVKVYRNADKSISVYRTNNADGVYRHWFDAPDKDTCTGKGFGFALGIANNEFTGNFSSQEDLVFSGMKIQKQELFPNNKIIDIEMEQLRSQIQALSTT